MLLLAVDTQKGKGTEDIRLIQFKEWMDEYNIQYPDEETARSKFSIFKASLDATSYDDLVRSLRRSKVDWVEAGVVSPVVRKQKHCGNCIGLNYSLLALCALTYFISKP